MNGIALVIVSSAIAIVGAWFVVDGLGRTRPSLAVALRSIHRNPAPEIASVDTADATSFDRIGAVVRRSTSIDVGVRTRRSLRTIDRRVDQHLGLLVAAALFGLVTPSLIVLLLRSFGVLDDLVVLIPAALGVLCAAIGPLVIHAAAIERAAEVRVDLRHQLSAYVDMVTMLLAGNTGHEGALLQAAQAGDGKLFRELRRRMREVSTTGRTLIDALDLVAEDFDLDELTQIAATARLAAAEGAPIARSLAAKCATLRATLASDQEAQARVRTDKVTPPLVGMTVLFMAVIIYPALNL